jgi:acyl carrier protein
MGEMNIEARVRAHIETELVLDRKIQLELDASLTGILDSAGVLELVIWVEDVFGFSVLIDQITPDDFASVRRIADWIRRSGGKLPE